MHCFIYSWWLTFFNSVAINYLNLTWLHHFSSSKTHIYDVLFLFLTISRRDFWVTTLMTIDMINEFTYSLTEQQLRQLALTWAHNLLKYEIIWEHIDILIVAFRRLSRRWKIKTLSVRVINFSIFNRFQQY